MTIKYIEKVLKDHSVPYMVSNNHILMDSMIASLTLFEQVEDVTDWSRDQLFNWLGY